MNLDHHAFSIEMISKDHFRKILIDNNAKGSALVEGELGELFQIEMVEGVMLQITGENGVFRIDITERELIQGLAAKRNHGERR